MALIPMRNTGSISVKIFGAFAAMALMIGALGAYGISAISRFQYISIAASIIAFLFAAGVTLLLARRMIQPLSAAARIADRIARGELNTPIPSGGRDETGTLLRSMTVMQDNIRVMM